MKHLFVLFMIGFYIFIISIVSIAIWFSHRNREYKCSECSHIFTPKWYDFGIFVNLGMNVHPLKCPNCHKRSPCKRYEPDS